MARTTTTERTKTVFMSIIDGRWAEKVEKGTEGAKERVNKKNETVYEMLYDDVSGVIKSMVIEKRDHGKQLNVLIDDVGEAFTLSIPVESRYFGDFVNKISCADLKKEVRLAPFSFIPNGETEKKSGMNVYQPGNPLAITENVKKGQEGKLPRFFTKEKPQGMPQPMKDGVPLKDGDKLEDEEWKAYFLQVSIFLQKHVEKIAPKPTAAPSKKEEELPTANAPATDDLPF